MIKSVKKPLVIVLILGLFLCFNCAPVYADYTNKVLRKLGRGFANTGLGWFEIMITIQETGEKSGIGAAVSYGLFKGLADAIARTAVGLIETVTFIIPIPKKDFGPIITDPEFIFDRDVPTLDE